MKRILGLDLGTTSIGWALVNEAENNNEQSSITRLGVRIVPLTIDEQTNFEKGKSITTNADRTLKRSMRRNLQRYKLRRDALISCLKKAGFITGETILTENGPHSTFATLRARAKAVSNEVSLEELARILLMINKKRGYKSSRKAQSTEEGSLIDGMEIAKKLHDEKITPGQYVYSLLLNDKRFIPDFYRSDLQTEFDLVWTYQKMYHPEILTDDFYDQLQNKSKTKTSSIFLAKYGIYTADNKGAERRLQQYRWRTEALKRELTPEELAFVIADINGAITGSSGYLGAISDRSKELYFKNQTIGQYILKHIEANPHYSLKNQTFYRQDYIDEFERIWETQAQFHHELTPELKKSVRDIIIFYQRPLKSKKAMLDICTFENRQIEITEEGKTRMKTVGLKVCPKSSPLFQEYKIWQVLNNLEVEYDNPGEGISAETEQRRLLTLEEMRRLAHELLYKDKLSKREALTILFGKAAKRYDLNYKEIEGNRTIAALYRAYFKIVALSGHEEYDTRKLTANEIEEISSKIFSLLDFSKGILHFDASLEGHAFDQQPLYQLWHLLYSYEDDNSKTGNEALITKLQSLCHCNREYAQILAGITFQEDYGSLSAKAMRKILPYLKQGLQYDEACAAANYRHSERSRTKEELESRTYKDHLDLLPRNSLRNPVVEKILNQMINVVNEIVATYGKPDEIRIELARELKNSKEEREQMDIAIRKNTADSEKYRKILEEEFGIQHATRNDIIRYKLYNELKQNGYKTLYSNTYIPREELFSKRFDIEHIIPKARIFDDSFSNKTLEVRDINIEKGDMTAYDFVAGKYDEKGVLDYEKRVEELVTNNAISKTKRNNLLMKEADIPSDFLQRDLRDSQYIAKKAREILEQMVPFVVTTTGSITKHLREDWQLVGVMQELNWQKYDSLGLTETYFDKNGNVVRHIKNWTKRNDHRHHAMDALTIAFTKRSIVQYLNNMNARSDKSSSIYGIEQKELNRDNKDHKLVFNAPMPLNEFRAEAKKHLDSILVSIKAKNKVVTKNINRAKTKDGHQHKIQLTPRGALHNETVYGKIKNFEAEYRIVDGKFTEDTVFRVSNRRYREALAQRLAAFGNDPKKAFTGKNSLEKNPIWLNADHSYSVPLKVKLYKIVDVFTIKKAVDKDLKIDKVIDGRIRELLQQRLNEFNGDAAKAFSNLDDNPIWLNKEKGIAIKRVKIRGIASGEPIRVKRDAKGGIMNDEHGNPIPNDYVNTANNHHVAVFRDASGNLHERVVSFYEATTRAMMGYPIIDKDYKQAEGWQFLFSMKQNEYFVFPSDGFNPSEIDLTDPQNYSLISPNLYRVQKFSEGDYFFRHHLETTVETDNALRDITWKRIRSIDGIDGAIKVRVDHIGRIVSVGEY